MDSHSSPPVDSDGGGYWRCWGSAGRPVCWAPSARMAATTVRTSFTSARATASRPAARRVSPPTWRRFRLTSTTTTPVWPGRSAPRATAGIPVCRQARSATGSPGSSVSAAAPTTRRGWGKAPTPAFRDAAARAGVSTGKARPALVSRVRARAGPASSAARRGTPERGRAHRGRVRALGAGDRGAGTLGKLGRDRGFSPNGHGVVAFAGTPETGPDVAAIVGLGIQRSRCARADRATGPRGGLRRGHRAASSAGPAIRVRGLASLARVRRAWAWRRARTPAWR